MFNIKRLFLLIYVLIIAEGVLRKWLFPSLSSLIFFIKDPFVVLIYFYAFQAKLFYKCAALYFYVFISILIVLQAIVFILVNPEGLVIYVYGIRNYLIYIPLIFVAANCIDKSYAQKIIKFTLWLSIPIAILVLIQYTSSPVAYINKGLAQEGFVFQVMEGVVRPYGTFTFTTGHVLFVASLFSFILSLFLNDRPLKYDGTNKKYFYFGICGCLLFMFFTTGSRSVYAYAAIIILVLTFVNVLAPRKKITQNLLILYLALLVVLVGFSYTDIYSMMLERNLSAIDSEGSPVLRALSSLFAFSQFFNETPVFGYGVGTGTNAAAVILRGGSEQGMGFLLAEDEWSRIVLELGYIIGGIYIFFRIFLVAWFLKLAFHSYRNEEVLPIILFGFVGPIVLNGVMTMQGTVLAYGVIFSSILVGVSLHSVPTKR